MKKIFFLQTFLFLFFYLSNAQNCNNWLYTPSRPSFAQFGQINITGNKITVEATFNRTTAYSGGLLYAGDLVSKHNTPADVNYLLRPNDAEITTSNGYFRTPDICEIELNKTYHVAMVYDGATLKFYRNGFLMSQIAATGNLFQNTWKTQVGFYDPQAVNTNFIGNINEVRIWNVAKSQAELKTYMNTSLPNPTTQPGLQAYYTFDNLLNKQGNASYNGVLGGSASINQTNPNCAFVIDSCATIVNNIGIGGIINDYTPVLAFNPCENKITVEDATKYNTGDTVLMIQMKGAVIDSTNTAAFGTVTDYKNSGNYEFNYVKSKAGNIIELKNVLTRQYDIPNGKVQLIRVPYYDNVNITSTLTCLPWDGKKGGVLVLNVANILTLNSDIDVTGKGFAGGKVNNPKNNSYYCHENDYYYPNDPIKAAPKGEAIADISILKSFGKGALANGGGGGLEHNSGGGGGSNSSNAGTGGNEWITCGPPSVNGGLGGKPLLYSTIANKIFLGGGGGGGHCDNIPGFNPNGGNGGGIIIIQTNSIKANSFSLLANGAGGVECFRDAQAFKCHEGMGGGGGGGVIIMQSNSYLDNLTIEVKGGKGADMNGELAGKLGPGGGGSGGICWLSNTIIPPNVSIVKNGGINGVNIDFSNDSFGATSGQDGNTLLNLKIPLDSVLFRPNIDSVKINETTTACKTFDFKGLGFTRTFPVNQWQWYFGDNSTANTQNTSHTYVNTGTYNVKLIITDINGCKDSVVKAVTLVSCDSTIINTYTPVLAFNPCENKITVEDATKYNTGDTVLMIQMKGAVIDSTNTAAFGTVTDYKNSGNYEFNYVKSKSGNIIELKNVLTRQYDIPNGKVQLIRVPYYDNINITSTLTCLPWDGNKGGVLVLNAKDTITLNANIDVSGRGFKGGNGVHKNPAVYNCDETQFYYAPNTDLAAGKGEGIAILSTGKTNGRGKYANGGGGGNSHNSGGGGGANGNAGGFGGYQFEGACSLPPFDNRGFGGSGLTYSNATNKAFLGGGGGAGHANNPELFFPNGGNGGGICIITGNVIKGNAKNIFANGDSGLACTGVGLTGCHEGMGGGGGAGAILLNVNNYLSAVNIKAKGGKGADMIQSGNLKVAPGGGGSGGICWINTPSSPANLNIDVSSGTNGVCTGYGNDPWGAEAGKTGSSIFNLVVPVDNILYSPNIDSVRINESAISCQQFDFKGIAYTRSSPVNQWQWFFGDNSTANNQNTLHSYTAPGSYIVKLVVTDINGCKDSISKTISVGSRINFDFSYKQDICNPLSVQFFNIGNTPLGSFWSFGDGNTINGNPSPSHIYNLPGNYTVKYSIQNGICSDTVIKIISVNILDDDIILTPDTTICFGTTKQLRTLPSLSFCWSPVIYLNDPKLPNPVTSTPGPITYYFTAEVPGNNLIINGDFSTGNTGFTSEYVYASPNITEGQYFVGTNPQLWNSSLSNCKDHTSGNGNMMLVNGAPVGDVNVWKQTVAVIPNTNYAFSTWIEALYPPNPAQLSFSINGGTLGNLITASLPTCTWSQFYTTWNSGNNTSATISIVNKNTFVQGNDFALDDISFSPVLIKRDSVKITIDTVQVKTIADTSICDGNPVQLNATGANTYKWLPAAGLNNNGIANPIATPANTTQYIVTGTSNKGCTANDTMNIFIKPLPVITKTADTTICKNLPLTLFASGGGSYSWSPAATLNNASIANPVASPVDNTTYHVTVTGINNCSKTDSVKVFLQPLPVFSISPDKTTCVNKNVSLSAGGGTTYLWSPASTLNNPGISNPVSSADVTTTYTVKIKDKTCNDSATLSATVFVKPAPDVTVSKSNDIECSLPSAQLTASGADKYVWTPSTGLNNSNIKNPLATIRATQMYTVTGTDTATGCSGTATVMVSIAHPFAPEFFVPNSFSPNGDGRNDCFKITYYGSIVSAEILIYNRFGNLVFYTQNINDCWDGTYKGKAQNAGNFVYYLRIKNECMHKEEKGNLVLIR